MAQDLKNKPFVVLGVNTDDEDRSVIAARIRESGVTWPTILDGPTAQAPTAALWNVRSYPTLVVIDARGIIRWRGHLHEKARRVIDQLLSEQTPRVQEGGAPQVPMNQIPLDVKGIAKDLPFKVRAKASDTMLRIWLQIDKGWHMYGRDTGGGTPVTVSILKNSCFEAVGSPRLTTDADGRIKGDAMISLPLRRTKAGATLSVRVDYTVCDASRCLPPADFYFQTRAPASRWVYPFAQSNHRADVRGLARILFVAKGMLPYGQLAFSYGRPVWRKEHGQALQRHRAKGIPIRLGANFWSLLYTDVPITIGETKIEPGVYCIALHAAKEASFAMLLRNATEVMMMRQDAWRTFKLKWPISIPLLHSNRKKPEDRLTITLTPHKKTRHKASLRVAWGPHELFALVTAHLPATTAQEDRLPGK